MRLLASFLLATSLSARIIVVSLDGMSYQALTDDPVTGEMTALRAVADKGVQAQGLTPHFPSTTSNSHAALFTGAWGDINGITGNSMPVAPRSEHTAFERVSGYRSDGLRAEPLWVTAGRQGVATVALQVPQAYPFTKASVGDNPKVPPVVVNGYQTRLIARERLIRRTDVTEEACGGHVRQPDDRAMCFEWSAGPVTLHGRMDLEQGAYRSIAISGDPGVAPVVARIAPLESEPPRQRELARYFSDGLYLGHIPDSTPAMVYFRLFALAQDGSDFQLFETPIQELAIHHGTESGIVIAGRLLRDAGGFIPNGPSHGLMQEPFVLGTPLWKGGDGTAERRYLEACELVARQSIRHARWFLAHYAPELFLGYLSFPDEIEHNWKGVPAVDARYSELRRWAYVIVNRAVAAYTSDVSPRDHIIFVSDHGMAAVTHEVAINAVLREAGLLDVNAKGRLDPARTKAMHIRNCVLVNTEDWKDGIVPMSQRTAVMAQVRRSLEALRDPVSGQAVITRIYDTADDALRFGFGGPNGSDMCFDYIPGYAGSDSADLPVVKRLEVPIGYHGLDPSRPEMKAILIGAGPRLRAGQTWLGLRSIDVAPLVANLLGIQPPRSACGKSPLRSETGVASH